MIPPIDRIAVIVAMPSELQHLPELPSLPVQNALSPWPHVTWEEGHVEITAMLCGIGMIRAAAATESAIREHTPDAILNFGCTGAHREDVHVGDVIIGTRSVAHASMVIDPSGTPRFDLHDGALPSPPGETGFASSLALLSVARDAAEGWSLRIDASSGRDSRPCRIHEGVVASADIWTQSPSGIQALTDRHHSLCEDMEAGAIATIAHLHEVPFLTIKDISNNELHKPTEFDPNMSHLPEAEVGRRAALLTGRVIERIVHASETSDTD